MDIIGNYTYYNYYIRYYMRLLKNKYKINLPIKEYGSEYPFLEPDELNLYIKKIIEGSHPFLFGKIGGSESFAMRATEFSVKKGKACSQLCMWSGFFPEDIRLLDEYCDIMKTTLSNVDLLYKWDKPCEEYFLKKYCRQDSLSLCGFSYEWINKENPWTMYLKGKRVLVIHPFVKSIEKQYEKREKLFKNPNILPEFELITLKAVQTIADEVDIRFRTWFEALDYMRGQIDQIDFDIALIGCGAYGLPLGDYVKRRGKVAMHMGGYLQLLFGILGRRWYNEPIVLKNKNQYWIEPSEEETPKGSSKVENGCYW